jgi:DNA phosphorothioation-dependent restriction protein DptG
MKFLKSEGESLLHVVILLVVLWAFLLSSIIAFSILSWKNNKTHSRWAALLSNTMVLTIAAMILYEYDIQSLHKQANGIFGSLGIMVLLFFIPINSWLTFLMIEIKMKWLSPR